MRPKNHRLLNIASGTEGIVWPPVMQGAKATLVALLHQLEDSQWFPGERIFRNQFAQLALLAEHAARHSPNFRARLEAAGLKPADLAAPEGFRRLPPLTRRDIQKAGPALYCTTVPPAHLPLGEIKTSGSTGEPVVVRKTALTNLFWMATTFRNHFWHQHDFSKRLSTVRTVITEFKEHPNWGNPVSLLFDSGALQAIPNTTDVQTQVRLIRQFQPQYLLVFPSTVGGILDECSKQGASLPGLERIMTVSEMLTPEFRKKAETFFNVKINDIYSSAEMGTIALQCPESGMYHIMAENTLLEVLDGDGKECAEGQTGRIVVTDLQNFATPLIRYSIGDYAEVGGACPCGRGLPALRRVLGRERNLIMHPDGTRHRPTFGSLKLHEIVAVNQFQFIQHDIETIEVKLVTETAVTAAQENKLRKMIQESLNHDYKISFTYFDQKIPLPPSGKFEEFICKV
jgi:phenylacetate-CoA ligase